MIIVTHPYTLAKACIPLVRHLSRRKYIERVLNSSCNKCIELKFDVGCSCAIYNEGRFCVSKWIGVKRVSMLENRFLMPSYVYIGLYSFSSWVRLKKTNESDFAGDLTLIIRNRCREYPQNLLRSRQCR